MKDSYYSMRRAVSREMRRLEARRKLTTITAVLLLIVFAALVFVTVATTSNAYKADVTVEQIVTTEAIPDNQPLYGTIEPTEPIKELPATEPIYTEEELEMLALVIYQEAGGDACSDSTRRMVAEVVLNRIASNIYPNTMEEVLTQYGQYGRLHWTGLVWPQRAQYAAEKHAVDRAYRIAEEVLTSDYRLLPNDVIFQAEFPQGEEVVAEQDGLYFCR